MVRDKKIIELMAVPVAQHDLEWLKESLQAAIKLEFATLPPYLCARWSIKSGIDPVARSIREIVREEMLHMALACNMLTAIGGAPVLNAITSIPTFPGPLPGGVHPGLIVSLQGLSKDAVKMFMEIEFPEEGPVALALDDSFPTIGAFYTAIQAAFDALLPSLSKDSQLEGPLGLSKLGTLDEIRQAIQLIKHQGEGSKDSPEDTGIDDLAHYYRFGEIYHGKKLRKDGATGKWRFDGDPIPFPEVWPMAEVPAGGYQKADVTPQVWQLLEQFDQSFTAMVNQLQFAWKNGSQDALNDAVHTMFELRTPAVSLMQLSIPLGSGNYGPCFRLV